MDVSSHYLILLSFDTSSVVFVINERIVNERIAIITNEENNENIYTVKCEGFVR